MDSELEFLVHFFNDSAYLFKTISMAEADQVDAVCDAIVAQRGWFGGRFAASERADYLTMRRFVERSLYEDYTQAYGPLKETIPVFFYLYPNMTAQRAMELAQERTRHSEAQAHVLMVRIEEIAETANITFTLNDSHTAYWQRATEAGIKCRGYAKDPVVLPDHNRVFPFAMIEEMHRKYRAQRIAYEVQVWDTQLLERLTYRILPSAAVESGGEGRFHAMSSPR